jgi:hypothetical protein
MNFIGLSGHLNSGASGHYETFHEGLYLAAQNCREVDHCVYAGSSLSKVTWFYPLIPPSIVSKFPWVRQNFANELFDEINPGSGSASLVHVYEGNLYWLFQVSRLIRRKPRTRGYVNFFNSARYTAIGSNFYRSYFFKVMVRIALKGIEDRIVISADTKAMAGILAKTTTQKFFTYPIYSILNPGEFNNLQRDEILFLIRGHRMMQELLKSLQRLSKETLDRITIHGVPTIAQIRILENMGMKVSRTHLAGSKYSDFYKAFSHVVILYDPHIFSNQSSGRLCDALVARCHLMIMMESALFDVASEFGNFSTFRISEIDQLFQTIISNRQPEFPTKTGDLPTSARAINQIILQNHESGLSKSSKIAPIEFRIVSLAMQLILFMLRIFLGVALRILRIISQIREKSPNIKS